MRRREFLRAGALFGGGAFIPSPLFGESEAALYGPLLDASPGSGFSGEAQLVILHTNDTHSRMDPFPMDGGRFQGLGGAARRATLIRRIRDANEHVVLLDAGDIFQGTPYFNFFGGEPEFRAMSAMGYDAATLGNHDFDNGVGGLVSMLKFADFAFVSANYDVRDSQLEGRVTPYVVLRRGPIRIGVLGAGIDFDKLVLPSHHEGVRYLHPFEPARAAARALKARGCHLVVCLSHLGYRYPEDRPSDRALAGAVPEIDIILGGHTHTFLDGVEEFRSPAGEVTLVNQVGWGGMRLGRIDIRFDDLEDRGAGDSGPIWSDASYVIDRALDA